MFLKKKANPVLVVSFFPVSATATNESNEYCLKIVCRNGHTVMQLATSKRCYTARSVFDRGFSFSILRL